MVDDGDARRGPHYSNLDSEVGIKPPAMGEKDYITIRAHTEVKTPAGYRYVGSRYSETPTNRISDDIRLYIEGREPSVIVVLSMSQFSDFKEWMNQNK